MRCRRCGEPAAINMRHYKLALCAEHYPAWFVEKTQRTILKYRMFTYQDRILVAVSGGKDSLALWDVLLQLGYQVDGLYIDLGIDGGFGYSTVSKEKAQAFATRYPKAHLHIVSIPNLYGESIVEVAHRKHRTQRPCAVCGLIKRHEMNRVALEAGYTVLATGHNLDDEAAVLFGNVLHWKVGYLQRQSPVLPADGEGLARKVKPLCRFYERETAAYTLLRDIDYIYDECPYAKGATSITHKETLTQMEHDAPGTKLQFYLHFLQAKQEQGLFGTPEDSTPDMHPCSQCGQPTTATDICAFCRLWT
ncbi:MAG: adenine nucleotide alpha hydrolase family protein [Anaerolineae bacterium]|nr:adenine nucleotide alpha hydrolase family protein [Anaerolineae bacterium]